MYTSNWRPLLSTTLFICVAFGCSRKLLAQSPTPIIGMTRTVIERYFLEHGGAPNPWNPDTTRLLGYVDVKEGTSNGDYYIDIDPKTQLSTRIRLHYYFSNILESCHEFSRMSQVLIDRGGVLLHVQDNDKNDPLQRVFSFQIGSEVCDLIQDDRYVTEITVSLDVWHATKRWIVPDAKIR
jgi:hypothetical protein